MNVYGFVVSGRYKLFLTFVQTHTVKKDKRKTEVEQEIGRHTENEIFKLAAEVQRLQNENTDLTTITLRLEEENDQIKAENSDLKEINNFLHKDRSSLEQRTRQKIISLNNQNQQHREENIRKNNEIQQHVHDNRKKDNDIRQLQLEKDQIEKEKQQLQEAKNSMESQIQQLREENIRKNSEIEQHVHENRKKDNDICQLQLQKNRIEKLNQQLHEEKSSIESQLYTQIQQLRQEKSDMEHENLQLQEANREKNNVIQAQEENNRNLSNNIQQLQEQNDRLSNQLQSLRQENHNMELEIQKLHENTGLITEGGTVTFSTDDILGKGGWAAVYKGNFYGTKVAVKEYYEVILSRHNLQILEREIKIASQCRHPNLLQMICATKNERNRLLIVTELMDMTLRTLLEQRANENSQLEPSQVKLISLDVARGLNYLHLQEPDPIIHRDVSSANVLLWVENGSVRRAKISDYGSANFMQACNTANPGAALYAAPEARGAQQSPKVSTLSCLFFVNT